MSHFLAGLESPDDYDTVLFKVLSNTVLSEVEDGTAWQI